MIQFILIYGLKILDLHVILTLKNNPKKKTVTLLGALRHELHYRPVLHTLIAPNCPK